MVEYEACIAGIEALKELWVKEAKVFGGSTLVIVQAQWLWKVKEENLKPYQQYLEDLTKTFNKIECTFISRAQNQLQMPWLLQVPWLKYPKEYGHNPQRLNKVVGQKTFAIDWENVGQEDFMNMILLEHDETDYVDFVKSCHDYQIHANLNHVPPSELYNMTSPWPVSIQGIDVIGKIAPKASNGHEYILVAIDYFIKWVEAVSYFVFKAKHVA